MKNIYFLWVTPDQNTPSKIEWSIFVIVSNFHTFCWSFFTVVYVGFGHTEAFSRAKQTLGIITVDCKTGNHLILMNILKDAVHRGMLRKIEVWEYQTNERHRTIRFVWIFGNLLISVYCIFVRVLTLWQHLFVQIFKNN